MCFLFLTFQLFIYFSYFIIPISLLEHSLPLWCLYMLLIYILYVQSSVCPVALQSINQLDLWFLLSFPLHLTWSPHPLVAVSDILHLSSSPEIALAALLAHNVILTSCRLCSHSNCPLQLALLDPDLTITSCTRLWIRLGISLEYHWDDPLNMSTIWLHNVTKWALIYIYYSCIRLALGLHFPCILLLSDIECWNEANLMFTYCF